MLLVSNPVRLWVRYSMKVNNNISTHLNIKWHNLQNERNLLIHHLRKNIHSTENFTSFFFSLIYIFHSKFAHLYNNNNNNIIAVFWPFRRQHTSSASVHIELNYFTAWCAQRWLLSLAVFDHRSKNAKMHTQSADIILCTRLIVKSDVVVTGSNLDRTWTFHYYIYVHIFLFSF